MAHEESGLVRLELKPMSVNQCWYGRKNPTEIFKQYRLDVDRLLPDEYTVPEGELFILFKWGLSNRGNDIDNSCKPFLDALQLKYGFNDNKVYSIIMEKIIVPKGKEFIEFEIRSRDDVKVTAYDWKLEEVVYG